MTLRLEGGLVARGRVRVDGGYEGCRSRVPVKIFRNGKVVEKLETRASGRFKGELPDEPGRYFARALRTTVDDVNVCAQARSKTRRI